MGMIIEHYAGAFPVWLSPVQAVVIPITDRAHDYAEGIHKKLIDEDIRSEIDKRNEKLQYKIRELELQKIPYMLIVGDKEKEAGTLSLRARKEGSVGTLRLEEFLIKIKKEISSRS